MKEQDPVDEPHNTSNYYLAVAESAAGLEIQVNDFLKDHPQWRLQGGVSVTHNGDESWDLVFAQAIVKERSS